MRHARSDSLCETDRYSPHHVYTFPSFKLGRGKSVKLHSAKGTNTRGNLYLGRGWYVWNNTGNKAILRSSSGTLKDTCKWGDGKGTRTAEMFMRSLGGPLIALMRVIAFPLRCLRAALVRELMT